MTSGNISRHKVSLSAFPKHSFRASARTISCAAPPSQNASDFQRLYTAKRTTSDKPEKDRLDLRKRYTPSSAKMAHILGQDGAHPGRRQNRARQKRKDMPSPHSGTSPAGGRTSR